MSKDDLLRSAFIDCMYNLCTAVYSLADKLGQPDIGNVAERAQQELKKAINQYHQSEEESE